MAEISLDFTIQEDTISLGSVESGEATPLTFSETTEVHTGMPGEDGATFTPHVDADGTLYWTNDSNLDNPDPVNIRGPQGETGPQGEAPDLSVYYTKEETDAAIQTAVGALDIPDEPDLSVYYTKEETDAAIQTAVGALDIPDEPDLSVYYTKEETDAAIQTAVGALDIPDEPDLSVYYTKEETDAKVKKAHTPRNLLDNSYFVNPINQRGATSYTGPAYSIDRWKLSSSATTLTIEDGGGVTLPATGSVALLVQHFPPGTLAGKTLTFAVCLATGEIVMGTNVFPASGSATSAGDGGDGLFLSFDARSGTDAVRLGNDATTAAGNTILWAALYEGEYTAETLPEYVYKGYAAELAECQRYYYQSWDGATINSTGLIIKRALHTNRLMPVDLAIMMRTTPTITIYSTDGTKNVIKEWISGTAVDSSSFSAGYASNQRFNIVNNSDNFVAEKEYYFHYSASADL